jgi:hypothetical protein
MTVAHVSVQRMIERMTDSFVGSSDYGCQTRQVFRLTFRWP